MEDKQDTKPDVDKIVADLRSDMSSASEAVPAATRKAVANEDNLHHHLSEANRQCATGNSVSGWRKLFLKPLAPWQADVNGFNASVVRVLNRLVRVLEGDDLPESGAIVDQQKRRMNLTEKMNDRIRELEDRIEKLEKDRQG